MDRMSAPYSQINFSGYHGGALRPSDVKKARPFSNRKSMHVVLKTTRFKNLRSPKNFFFVQSLIKRMAKRKKIRIEKLVVEPSSIHLVTHCGHRDHFFAFTRSVTGLIARRMLGAEKSLAYFTDEGAQRKVERFWLARPFTRIVQKGRANLILERMRTTHILKPVGFMQVQESLSTHPFFSSA